MPWQLECFSWSTQFSFHLVLKYEFKLAHNDNYMFLLSMHSYFLLQVVRAIIAMLSTTLPGCDDGAFRRVFKALLPFEKEEKKKVSNTHQ